MTAPDAEEADEEGPAARIDSSRCIHDDVNSDGNTSHVDSDTNARKAYSRAGRCPSE